MPSYRTKAMASSFDDAPTRRLANERMDLDFVWTQEYKNYVEKSELLLNDSDEDDVNEKDIVQGKVMKEYGAKCRICDKFVPTVASLQPHMIQCAKRHAIQQTPCPTCKWPVSYYSTIYTYFIIYIFV